MKKLIVFLLMLIFVLGLTMFQSESLHELFLFDSNTFYIYSNSQNNNIGSGEIVKNGDGEIVKFDRLELIENYHKLNLIAGESLVIKNLTLNQIMRKLNLEVLSVENFNEIFVINGYSNKLKNYLNVDGKKQNVQIKYCLNYALIGYPLIMQGF